MLPMTLPKPPEDLTPEPVGVELVLVDPGANEAFVLNPTGARVSKLPVDGASDRALAARR
jgi:hypothetical protein